jgi:hypothetical protein
MLRGAQGIGERRMEGRLAIHEAERRTLAFVQAASKEKPRPHSAPSAKQRDHDQAQNRPQPVILSLLAARVRHLAQHGSQIHSEAPRIGETRWNQMISVHSRNFALSSYRPGSNTADPKHEMLRPPQ